MVDATRHPTLPPTGHKHALNSLLIGLSGLALLLPAHAETAAVIKPLIKPIPHVIPVPVRPTGHKKSPAKSKVMAKEEAHGEGEEESASHWSYVGPRTGPSSWARMNPAYAQCEAGKEQSPVNISGAAPQPIDKLKFSYGLSRLQIVNNGHTIQSNIDGGSTLEAFGDTFELKQFHFHTPSEEQINGKSYPLVAHFVHKSESGKLAVIAILFKVGRENPVIDTLWDRMPKEHGETRTYEERVISPASLLPEKLGFYTLMGSLTTPPCSEGVRWIILKTPAEISAAQLARFRKEYPMNARPIQPLNGRMIVEAM